MSRRHEPTRDASPESLAVAAAGGDADAFAALVERFQGRLYSFLLRRTRDPDIAEELAQEAFVRAWQSRESYDPRWNYSTWLFTIATRLDVSRDRQRRRRRTGSLGDADPAEASPRLRLVRDDDAADRAREGARLWDAASQRLTPDQHTALWLRYAEGLDIGAIATVLGKSPVAVRVLLFRARRTLAAVIDQATDDGTRQASRAPREREPGDSRGPAPTVRFINSPAATPWSNGRTLVRTPRAAALGGQS